MARLSKQRNNKIQKPQMPEGYHLTKDSTEYFLFAQNKCGEKIVWVIPGKNEKGEFVEGFWMKTDSTEKIDSEKYSRFRQWLADTPTRS